jgi:hypothetical protein
MEIKEPTKGFSTEIQPKLDKRSSHKKTETIMVVQVVAMKFGLGRLEEFQHGKEHVKNV